MNKTQLIDVLAAHFEGNRRAAAHALDSVLDTITREVAKGEKVAITGFGSFEKRVREARWVRNPQTGDRVRTSTKEVPAFRPGADLKNVVSGAKLLPQMTVAAATAPVKAAAAAARKAAGSAAAPGTRPTAKKSTAKKAPASTSASAAKKTSAKKAPASTSAVKKSTAKKAPASTSAAKKTTAKKTSANTSNSTAKKATTKKATTKKTSTAKKAASGS